MEPKIVANIEIDLWKNGVTEEKLKNLLAEKFRVSSFQAAKSAHLGWLASTSNDTNKKGLWKSFIRLLRNAWRRLFIAGDDKIGQLGENDFYFSLVVIFPKYLLA